MDFPYSDHWTCLDKHNLPLESGKCSFENRTKRGTSVQRIDCNYGTKTRGKTDIKQERLPVTTPEELEA